MAFWQFIDNNGPYPWQGAQSLTLSRSLTILIEVINMSIDVHDHHVRINDTCSNIKKNT